MRVKKPNRDLNLQAEEIKNKIWNRDKIGSLKSLIFVWCNKNFKKKKKPLLVLFVKRVGDGKDSIISIDFIQLLSMSLSLLDLNNNKQSHDHASHVTKWYTQTSVCTIFLHKHKYLDS